MNAAQGGALEGRYRRLLAWYPASPDPGWRDALAVTSLAAPVLLSVLLLGQDMGRMAGLLWHSLNGATGVARPLWPLAALLVPLALGLARLRRTAALATVALMAWMAVQATLGAGLQDPRLAAYLVLLGVEAAALAASPGALAAVPALTYASGCRLLMLLVVIPGSAFAVSLMTVAGVDYYSLSFAASQAALYLPPIILGGLTAKLISSAGRGPMPAQRMTSQRGAA